MTLHWPYDVLTPRQERGRLQGVAMTGGQSTGGIVQSVRLDGGGLWVIEQSFLLHGDGLKLARGLDALLDGGSASVVVRVSEQTFAPDGLTEGEATFSDGSTFSDGAEFAVVPPGAVTTAAAGLRATTLEVDVLADELSGDERFSITHPTKGKRMYQVAGIDGGTLTIRPPLREAVAEGTELDFLNVGVVCRLTNPDDFIGPMGPDRIAEASAVWIEAFD